MAFVADLMGFIDGAVSNAAENTYVAVATNYGGVITLLATVAIVVFGIAVSLGVISARAQDIVQLLLRIILVSIFATSWQNFEVIYTALVDTSDDLVTALFSAANFSTAVNSTELAEEFSNQAQETASSVVRAEGSITRGVLGAVMYILLAGLQAAYVLIAGFAKIMIGVLIGLAPFAIAATILPRTQFLFEAWVSSLIGYALYPVAAAGIMGFIASVGNQAFLDRGDDTLIGITGVIVIILVGIFALKSIPQIASNITGQLNLAGVAPEALRIVGRPAVRAGEIGRGVSAQFASGASTGGETSQRSAQNRRFGSAMDMRLANAGAAAANNRIGRAIQRRRDTQFAREANERTRKASSSRREK